MLRHLRGAGVGVKVIGPLQRNFKYLYVGERLISRLRKQSIQLDRHRIALKSYARQIARELDSSGVDAVFSPSSVPISLLETSLPIIFWTDAVTEAMVGYYGGQFNSLSARELRIAHEQEQAALTRATFAIYASEWAAESIARYYPHIPTGRVQVVPFGPNIPVPHNESDVRAFIADRDRERCNLLFLGVDWERKGGRIAFEAAKILNERGIPTTLKVAGTDCPDASFVQKFGFVSKRTPEGQERLAQLLRTSHFLILPTRAEAVGIVFCEASAYGLPVIATDTGGVRSYVRDGTNGYCLELSASGVSYADKIHEIMSNRERYHLLAMDAFRYYRECLNWESGIRRLLSLTKAAISQRAQEHA
jgi:glycosyltransferase involved in cell wall biosynthesis